MCWACDNERIGLSKTWSFSTYPPERIEQDYWEAGNHRIFVLAQEQRANLETIKVYKVLCQRHIDNYEQIVKVLESFIELGS